MSDLPKLFSDEEFDKHIPKNEVIDYGHPHKHAPSRADLAKVSAETLKQAFPKIWDRVHATWGHPECEAYLDDLVAPQRDGRQGFPSEVLTAIVALANEHHRTFGTFKKAPGPWDQTLKGTK